jgi:hypothetical protein
MAGAGLLTAGALAGALWVTLGAGPSSTPPAPTVQIQQAAATATPTTTVTKTVTVKPKAAAVKPTASKKAAVVKTQAKVNSVTAQDQPADPPATAEPLNGGTDQLPTNAPTLGPRPGSTPDPDSTDS